LREQDCPSNTDYLNPNQPAHTGRGVAVSADFVKTFTAIFKSRFTRSHQSAGFSFAFDLRD
jgi:hypothetical protein